MRLFIDDSDDAYEHCNVRRACELNKTFSTELDAAHNRTSQPHITHVSALIIGHEQLVQHLITRLSNLREVITRLSNLQEACATVN